MSRQPHFTIRTTLHRGAQATLYRARRDDGRLVLLKVLAFPHARAEEEKFAHEFELTRAATTLSILRALESTTHDGRPALVFEHFDGATLPSPSGQPMDIGTFLQIAPRIAAALAEVHRDGIIHTDLSPENVLVGAETCAVKITGFGIATRLSRTQPAVPVAAQSHGSLPYMSPEATGRMNRVIDQRTDLYSLGAILYGMLVGSPVFEAMGALEWVYCHIARRPVPPSERLPALPRVLSDIVMKLLAKVASDRYQSAYGLAADLERCLAEWTDKGAISPFRLGDKDISDRFQLPQKLYGRDLDIARQRAAFERVAATGECELILLSGPSGIGKSSLVRELIEPIAHERAVFVTAKCVQHWSSVPYSTLVPPLRDLVLETLTQSEEQIADVRLDLQRALGANARLVIDFIPQLEMIIGPQPSVPVLPSIEAKFRFQSVFQRFIAVFARKARPVVLFLDDLQWVDPASLQLLEYILTHPDTKNLLAIAGVRDDEQSDGGPIGAMLEQSLREGARVDEIALHPLSIGDLTQLVMDMFHCESAVAAPLACLLHARTAGNPFFAIQFLTMLHQERLIEFAPASLAWRWDLTRIEASAHADNVVEMMLGKIRRLPAATRAMMSLAACIGNDVDAEILARISQSDVAAVHATLEESVLEGLMLRRDTSYRFLHDRILDAAYTMIPDARLAELHLSVARTLLRHTARESPADRSFEIANHFVLGASRIDDPAERAAVARLLLESGRKAKAATAYREADAFVSTASSLLAADSWQTRHDLTYSIFLERAECAALNSNIDEAEQFLAIVLAHADTHVETLPAFEIQVRLHTILGDYDRSIESGLRAFRLIGQEFPAHPTAEQVTDAYEATRQLIDAHSIERLLELPPVADPEAKAALRLASCMLDAAAFTDASLGTLLACFMVSASIRHGFCDNSPVGYAAFAMILMQFDRRTDAYRLGTLACELNERLGTRLHSAKVATLVEGTISPWVKPYTTGLAALDRAAKAGAENGDVLWAGYGFAELTRRMFIAGEPLADVYRETENRAAMVRAMKAYDLAGNFTSLLRCIQNLRGLTADSSTYDGDGFDVAAYEAVIERANVPVAVCSHYVWKLQSQFLFGYYDAALVSSAKANAVLWGLYRLSALAEFRFYDALVRAAVYTDVEPGQQTRYLAVLREHEKSFRAWADGCPENFASKHRLIAAEILRIEGQDMAAARGYEDAIRFAQEGRLVQNEAIAHEVASRFYRSHGLDSEARLHLREARACYARWGAAGKVTQLEREHPHLVEEREAAQGTAIGARLELLDLLSVTKASQSIAEEVDLDALIRRLTEVVLQQSGAERGCLLLARDGSPRIAAETRATGLGILTTIFAAPPDERALVPDAIVQYVWRTGERVILGDARDAAGREKFASDEYLARVTPRSVLCVPILRKTRAVGLLYLENNLIPHAFTPDRMAVLDVLASQAAISLEIAMAIQREQRGRDALAKSESKFRRISESNMIGFLFASLDGPIYDANDYFLRMLGYDRADIEAGRMTWRALTPPEHAEADRKALAELHTSGVCQAFEKEYFRKDGTRVPVLLLCARLEGSRDESVSCIVDLTERKRIEIERQRLLAREQRARADAERATRKRDEFIAIAAHELRTPLTPLRLQLHLLKKLLESGVIVAGSTGRHDVIKLLDKSDDQVDRLVRLVENLLDISKISSGRLVLEVEDVDLEELVTGVAKRFEREIARAGSVVHIRHGGGVHGRWDRLRIEQVVVNLLTNAIKYGAEKPIEIVMGQQGDRAILAVRDHGIGIAAKDQKRIFERFERAVTLQHFGGFGLGLYIIRQIVRAHGGDIRVESKLGAGATFTVELPLVASAQPARPMLMDSM